MKKIIIDSEEFGLKERIAACIGYFDGLHRGHQKLLERTIAEAERLKIHSALICFSPDPVDIIRGYENRHLFSDKQREKLIKEKGIDLLIVISFDEKMMCMDPVTFIEKYLNRMNIEELVCGYDFSFGYKGKGNSALLQKYGNFHLSIIDEFKYYGKKVSSSRIKEELGKGNLKLVNNLLGFEYYQILKVTKVAKKGSKWLVEAIRKEKNITDIAEGTYDKFSLKDDVFTFISDKEYQVNEIRA